MLELQDSIIFLAHKELGLVVEKNHQRLCVEKQQKHQNGGEIEVWGDGLQTRSFLYVDECVEAVIKLMESEFTKVL
jgi:GDP-D-mannose 3', 5'-epimerase